MPNNPKNVRNTDEIRDYYTEIVWDQAKRRYFVQIFNGIGVAIDSPSTAYTMPTALALGGCMLKAVSKP